MSYLMRPLRGSAAKLYEYAQSCPVIDTHEHLATREKYYNDTKIKFGQLFNPYISNDLASAGMPFPRDAWAALHCVDDDWDAFEPYWKAVKYSSYARPLLIALDKYYGEKDLTRENYLELVDRINANNVPGIFQRVMAEDCNIEASITCTNAVPPKDEPILKGNISSPQMWLDCTDNMQKMVADAGADPVKSLDEFLEVADLWMEKQVREVGAIEFKSRAMPGEQLDKAKAEAVFARLLKNEQPKEAEFFPLWVYVRERSAAKAAELGVPIALHTGVWGDFRTNFVEDIIGFLQRNPDTQVDVYHLGIPHVRACIQICKNFPNAWMNLCWAHIVAQEMTVQSLREMIDMVPMNKIFAFGADYAWVVEKIYGHLQIARENVAIALGERVDDNLMGLDDAKATLRAWFYDNPKAFYNL